MSTESDGETEGFAGHRETRATQKVRDFFEKFGIMSDAPPDSGESE